MTFAESPKKPGPTDAERIVFLQMKIQALEQMLAACDASKVALESHIAKPAAEAVARANQFIKALSDKCLSGKLDQDAKCVEEPTKK